MSKLRSKIGIKGGGILYIRELVNGSSSTTWTDLGYIKQTPISQEAAMLESTDETGAMITINVGNKSAKLTPTLMQAEKANIDIIRNAEGKYYEFYYIAPLGGGAFWQEWNGFGVIVPKFALTHAANTERGLPLELIVLKPKASYVRTPTDYNNTTGDYFVLIENATAKGAPTDTVDAAYDAMVE